MIYHVVPGDQWKAALVTGSYAPDSFADEGFIHASREGQVAGVLERYYRGQTGLLLLHIDENRLTAQLRYEYSQSTNEEFPHIFGPLNTNAVVKATPL